jgi:hypothetical protein
MLETLRQWAVPGALLMAGAWFASGIVAWVVPGGVGPGEPGETRFYLIEGLHAIGEVGVLAAIAGLYLYQASRITRWGTLGFRAAFVGTAIIFVSTVLWLAFAAAGGEGNLLTGLIFVTGMLGWLVGFPLFGVATLLTNVFPAWVGWLLIAFFPLVFVLFLVFNAYGVGGVIVGLIWSLLAYALWVHRSAPSYREAVA